MSCAISVTEICGISGCPELTLIGKPTSRFGAGSGSADRCRFPAKLLGIFIILKTLSISAAMTVILGLMTAYYSPRSERPETMEIISGILLLSGVGLIGYMMGVAFGSPG
jgi:hypothetical protein